MPEQPLDIPDPDVPGLPAADSLAAKEVADFSKRRSQWYFQLPRYAQSLDLTLKVLLFVFVIVMNLWWTHRVLQLVWESANTQSHYHLASSVLIALVTTSLANFLALVGIVAKHLYPSEPFKFLKGKAK